ncbi:type I-B CRISPR-associated protein Cas7/Csh2 [Halorussus caseinilyticus]|uniref:Type I-B CRISPR-associated protein Cas7/Csh2 n=1 Tax=Halorussus caseinilyticus TaxID=3034025 RepID=A0ABD5WIG0_9EURY|nr:type I-B CRISPR-associated protein Cas7/Csh2 [Halorussus sp. DT72]
MTETVDNRSEIVFVTDAQDCNPNGNPLGENRPRKDPITDQAVVTDVRLKRYLRDQLHADGHGVFIKKTGDESEVRARLALDVLGDITDADEVAEIENVRDEFLDAATDVRYFGATLSFNADTDNDLLDAVADAFDGGNYTGPVQFSPARSLNAVEENEESNTLTSVIATQDDKSTGGFDLDDNRLKYAIFPFHGLVDENGASDTELTAADVKRLDTLCWRAMKNQTISRSKVGQEPRLYARVEYATDGYHVGDLHNGFDRDPDYSKPESELRNVTDFTLDVTKFVDRLASASDHVETVHVVGDEYLDMSYDGERYGTAADLADLLESQGVPTTTIDVYAEFEETLPAGE